MSNIDRKIDYQTIPTELQKNTLMNLSSLL